MSKIALLDQVVMLLGLSWDSLQKSRNSLNRLVAIPYDDGFLVAESRFGKGLGEPFPSLTATCSSTNCG